MTFPFPAIILGNTTFFPVVEGTHIYENPTSSTNPVVHVLPTGIQAGELLLLFVCESGAGGAQASTPTGWTRISNRQNVNGNNLLIYRKTAVGGETTASQNEGSVGFSTINSVSYRISHWQGTPAINDTIGSGTTNCNPPSLTSGFGAVKTLWLAVAYNSFLGYSTTPANYSNIQQDALGHMAIGQRTLTAATEDPASFVANGNAAYCAATIAIRGLNT